jgi:hypothetical protein
MRFLWTSRRSLAKMVGREIGLPPFLFPLGPQMCYMYTTFWGAGSQEKAEFLVAEHRQNASNHNATLSTYEYVVRR